MHLKIPYLHANGQDEREDVQNSVQFSITDIYIQYKYIPTFFWLLIACPNYFYDLDYQGVANFIVSIFFPL